MIKLKNLLELNKITYNLGPTGKHKKRMMQPLTIFESEYTLPNQLPPENGSKETLRELKYLSEIAEDDDIVKEVRYFDKIKESFRELLEMNNLPYEKDFVKSVLRETGKFTAELKYRYNRPRPFQLAKFYGIELNGTLLESMNSPSYPSGHAIQGYVLGGYYAKKYPKLKEKFLEYGENVAHSRICAKAHYPSDKQFGKVVANRLLLMIKN